MKKITIAVDGMGGDNAPFEIVKGALQAISDFDVHILLIGKKEKLEENFQGVIPEDRITIIHTDLFIDMSEKSIEKIRSKKNCSIMKAAHLVKKGKADALVSAGNTAATVTAAILNLGRIQKLKPALPVVIPTPYGPKLLLDVGASIDCTAKDFLWFATMGTVYIKEQFAIFNPKIGLLNIGEEYGKGNMLAKQAYGLLKKSSLNFIGNVEGGDIVSGNVDIIICDGFIGNIILKFGEEITKMVFSEIKKELTSTFLVKIFTAFVKSHFQTIKSNLDPEAYGGTPILGIDGICIVTHGRAKAIGIKNSIKVAKEAVQSDIVKKLKSKLDKEIIEGDENER